MDYDSYQAQLRADGMRIGARARQPGALDAGVPDCPGWSLTDLMNHVGRIYRFVLVALETGRPPVKGSYESAAGDGVSVVDWFDAGHWALLARLSSSSPTDQTWTWWPADTSVGFWARRMCHETLVHRLDADGSLEFHAGVTDDLALDGVDEVLTRFLARSERSTTRPHAGPVSVDVESAGRRWRVVVDGGGIDVTPEPTDGEADAVVTGAPLDMLRWSWGRAPYGQLADSGQRAALAVVQAAMAEAAS